MTGSSGSQPSGSAVDEVRQEGFVDPGCVPGVGGQDRLRVGQEHVVADPLERPPGMLVRIPPGVVDVQRRAVVDEPGPAMPHQQVRVLRGAIRVGDQRVQPHDVRRERRIDDRAGRRRGRVEGQRAGQEVHAQVAPRARANEVVDLLVGLCVAEGRIDLDRDDVGDRQTDRPADLAGQPLRDERAGTLAGAAELDDVQALVVRLDEAGQRAALPQRGHVSGGQDRPHHAAERSRVPEAPGAPCSGAQVARSSRAIGATLGR